MVSDHVRYIFHDNKDRVALRTELRHVENYINMQRYVTAQPIDFQASAEPGLEGALIPALCLQTFVENKTAANTRCCPGRRSFCHSSSGGSLRCGRQPRHHDPRQRPRAAGRTARRVQPRGVLRLPGKSHRHPEYPAASALLYGDRFGFACRNLAPGTEFELIFPLHFEESQRKTDGRPCI